MSVFVFPAGDAGLRIQKAEVRTGLYHGKSVQRERCGPVVCAVLDQGICGGAQRQAGHAGLIIAGGVAADIDGAVVLGDVLRVAALDHPLGFADLGHPPAM